MIVLPTLVEYGFVELLPDIFKGCYCSVSMTTPLAARVNLSLSANVSAPVPARDGISGNTIREPPLIRSAQRSVSKTSRAATSESPVQLKSR